MDNMRIIGVQQNGKNTYRVQLYLNDIWIDLQQGYVDLALAEKFVEDYKSDIKFISRLWGEEMTLKESLNLTDAYIVKLYE